MGAPIPTSGNLTRWANQGVLLLNATLTVRAHQAGSHQRRGWEEFTDAAIRILAEQREKYCIHLMGILCTEKRRLHRPQQAPGTGFRTSVPPAAYNGFFGNKHFSRTNEYLQAHGQTPIEWLQQISISPAAIKQLQVLGSQIDIPVFAKEDCKDAVRIANEAIDYAKSHANDIVIIDTAGRLHIDENLMQELKSIKEDVKPHEILLVVDAMTGQDAVNVAEASIMI